MLKKRNKKSKKMVVDMRLATSRNSDDDHDLSCHDVNRLNEDTWQPVYNLYTYM